MIELRAGGTDITERRRSGVSHGAVRDIPRTPELTGFEATADGGLRIGALVTIDQLATAPAVVAGCPGLAAAAGGLATPQIRRAGTLGGSLLQRSRCWYYRHPATACLKKGGDTCPARAGNHRYGVAFDLGPCVAPHPSTIGAALLAYGATVDTDRRAGLPVAALFGDGSDGARDHLMEPGELLTAVRLPPPAPGERAAYLRAIGRAYAEWPLVECVARLVFDGDVVTLAAVAVGGVAPVPLRLPRVEAALAGQPASEAAIEAAAALAIDGAQPLPQTGYKLPLLVATVAQTLSAAIRR